MLVTEHILPTCFNVHIEAYSKWGSNEVNNRLKIRNNIFQFLEKSEIPFNKSSLLDLSQKPRVKSCCISISHSKNIGGYLISFEGSYGFDLENKKVTDKVCNRLDVLDDSRFFIENKMNRLYWSAKEASFKAISNHFNKDSLISNIRIEKDFFDKANKFLTYKFISVLNTQITGVGVVEGRPDYTFSIAKLKKP